jgi:peptide/nickel transport system permease protein
MGLLILQAINFADFPVMAAYLMFVGGGFVLVNLTVDLIYLLVDPRLRAR